MRNYPGINRIVVLAVLSLVATGLNGGFRRPDTFKRSPQWLRDRSLRIEDSGVSGTLGGE